MKKILFVAVVLVLCFTLIACSTQTAASEAETNMWRKTDPDSITEEDIKQARLELENTFPREKGRWYALKIEWTNNNFESDSPMDLDELETEFYKYFILHRYDDAVNNYYGYANLPYYRR